MVLIWRVDHGRDTTALATTVALWCHQVDARGASAHGTAPSNIYGANEPHGSILARGAGHLSRPARQKKKKKPVDAPVLGSEFLRGYFLLSFKLNFNNKTADRARGADGRPFLGFS